jgi:uncharacterized protein YcfL
MRAAAIVVAIVLWLFVACWSSQNARHLAALNTSALSLCVNHDKYIFGYDHETKCIIYPL